jgi:hypothetical protein
VALIKDPRWFDFGATLEEIVTDPTIVIPAVGKKPLPEITPEPIGIVDVLSIAAIILFIAAGVLGMVLLLTLHL